MDVAIWIWIVVAMVYLIVARNIVRYYWEKEEKLKAVSIGLLWGGLLMYYCLTFFLFAIDTFWQDVSKIYHFFFSRRKNDH